MSTKKFAQILNRISAFDFTQPQKSYIKNIPQLKKDLMIALGTKNNEKKQILFAKAAQIRNQYNGQRMVLRGLIEFSSYCTNTCMYCGLNATNTSAKRYKLSPEQILECVDAIWAHGIKTVVLQSGEDCMKKEAFAEIIQEIKSRYDMAITLSVGERSKKDYTYWKKAGADRYLLRIESTDVQIYERLHLNRSLKSRMSCLDTLQHLGYQTGSGFMVGLPGQSLHTITDDIIFLAKHNFDMIGIGPFIPHQDTPLRKATPGDIQLTLKAIALIRLVNKNAWLPATTAVGSLTRDYRVDALHAGANVIMPNFSPASAKAMYQIYPHKKCIQEQTDSLSKKMKTLASKALLKVDYSRADSLKPFYKKKDPVSYETGSFGR
ncbi:MAG TPA: [FeFe] hydrogenase H-cluster radical SAM maturase HydE [Treponemataceae bacterium]|nr:[FeFe] hydrogenase H-cluster radical SAM maturase HydE [Treponemataceae bacterium]